MGLILNKAAQSQISTQMFVGCIKLYLSTDIWTFKGSTSKFVTSVKSIQTLTRLMLPQKENPCLAEAARSHDQRSSAEKLVELCYWTAAEDYWLMAFICNSRCALEHLNASCMSSIFSWRTGAFPILFKIPVHFYFNRSVSSLPFLKQTPLCEVQTGCVDKLKSWKDISNKKFKVFWFVYPLCNSKTRTQCKKNIILSKTLHPFFNETTPFFSALTL